MPINVTAVGSTGAHTFRKTNVHVDSDFIYYKGTAGVTAENIPTALTNGTGFIYSTGTGALTGITDDTLVFVKRENTQQLKFSTTQGGSDINITAAVAGDITFNTPRVYDNKHNIDASTPSNQAVKYYTNGTALTGLTSGNTYFLRNVSVSSFAGSQALYTLASNTHTFTTCGQTGRVGPTQAQMRSAYDTSANGNWDETYISQGAFQGYQDWTVPVSGIYEFDVYGASGFDGSGGAAPGLGARVRGRVSLTKGEIITIACGQKGVSAGTWSGSGGGTFVVRKTGNEPLFVAGGGSADANTTAGRNGVLSQIGGTSSTGGIQGTALSFGGRAAGGRSGGGGGFNGRGENSTVGDFGGGSFLDGLTMSTNTRAGGYGGFGGGGQSDGNNAGQSGGGGGYSGGPGARTTIANASGGGGGSFIISSATNVATSTGLFDGVATFNGAAITNLSSYRDGEGQVVLSLISSFTTGNSVHPTAVDAQNNTNAIAIAPAGSSTHAFVPISMDLENDVIHSSSVHGLVNGEAVTLNFNGTAPTGLSNGIIYYINTVNTFTYRLSTTPSPTFTTINLTIPSSRQTATSDQIRKVVVNTATDTLSINNHGFQVDQPVQYDTGGGVAIAPLQDQATYYISEVIDANRIKLKTSLNSPTSINFTAAGTGTAHSFIFVTINTLEDTLYIPNHGLVSGQAVRYSNGGGTTIPGLTNNGTYYIIKVDNSIVKLATNQALTNIANITGVGTGTQSLLITSLDFTNNIITVPGHGFLQGELVNYDSRGQTVVNGLTTATPYYVIFIDGDNIKLATTPENASAGTAVDLLESPAGVGVHSLQSLSKTPDGIYTIVSTPSANTFTVEAKGNVPVITKTFNPRSSIDLNLSTFKIPSHGFITGTEVRYSNGEAGTDISGLTDDTDYYVVSVNRDYLRLATSADNAAAGITLTVSDFGTGVNHTFVTSQINGNVTGGGTVTVSSGSVLVNGAGTSFSKILKVGDRFRLFPSNTTTAITFAAADVNTTTNRITKAAHGFATGDTIVYAANGGVSPSPLVDGYYYFTRAVSSSEITLHNSAADATANTGALDFTTQGTGSGFTLTKTTPIGPIIRRITAIGSDTQITVDRPYANAYSAVSYSYPTFVYVRPEGYSLHRPFDGGVEMSVGAGTSWGQIVRQTRKYFRYQSGKGLQTSCGINFKPSIDLESMTQFSSTTIECKTRRPHGLISGLTITVSEAKDSNGNTSTVYNGNFQVTVVDLTTFRMVSNSPIVENRSYGFPQFFVTAWANGAVRTGMFDFQNGMFFEYDGQKLYAVRRSSTQQLAGTASALQGSELIFGTNTSFQAQLTVGDYIVMRGQSYRVVQITSNTRMSVRPEYKGASGTEKEFDPGNGTTGVVRTSTDTFQLVGHGFSNLLPVVYNSIDGEPIGGLINGRTYYIDLINNNSFRLKASPDSVGVVDISSVGTTSTHSFTPAKSGIIMTKTVDTRIPQENFSLDPCDGSGPTGYNLDLSKIQMAYIDYSWYGAGKIRFGFKTTDGQVQYVHEFVHNNNLYESYFRSGNLPARYEVVTYLNPTYIPYLFHWGTSVMMDGRFDDDNAYLFTQGSQTLNISGTTTKLFSSTGINLANDLITVQTHGFRTGDVLQFQSIAPNGFPGTNTLNPATQVVGTNTLSYLTNSTKYKAFVNSSNLIHLTPFASPISVGGTVARAGTTVTVVTNTNHGLSNGMYVGIYGITNANLLDVNGTYTVTVTNATTFTVTKAGTAQTTVTENGLAVAEVLNFTSQGNTQYQYFLYPDGSLNNSSGPNYQPLISLRLSPSVSSGLTGKLGDRDVINRMQLRLKEIGISTTQLVDAKLLLNPRLNNLNFTSVDAPSLTQIVEHTASDTVSGGVQVYNFKAAGGASGAEDTTTVDVSSLFELSNSILGGDSIYPDGPDILTIAVSRLTGNTTLTSAKMSWSEAQA